MKKSKNLIELNDEALFLIHEASLKRGRKVFETYSFTLDELLKEELESARQVFSFILKSNGVDVFRKRGERFAKPTEKQAELAFNLMRRLEQGRYAYIESTSEDKKEITAARRKKVATEDLADYFIIEWFDNKKWVDSLPEEC